MVDAKLFADVVTVTRALVAVAIAWMGFAYGPAAVPVAIVLMIACWLGDFLDGRIARLTQPPRHNWIGDSDIFFDTFVSLCLGAFLIGAGYVTWVIAFWYLVVWLIIFWRFGSDRNLLMLIQTFIYFWFVWVALRDAPDYGLWIVVEIGLLMAINWRGFTRKIVPTFINGMKSLRGGNGSPRHS